MSAKPHVSISLPQGAVRHLHRYRHWGDGATQAPDQSTLVPSDNLPLPIKPFLSAKRLNHKSGYYMGYRGVFQLETQACDNYHSSC